MCDTVRCEKMNGPALLRLELVRQHDVVQDVNEAATAHGNVLQPCAGCLPSAQRLHPWRTPRTRALRVMRAMVSPNTPRTRMGFFTPRGGTLTATLMPGSRPYRRCRLRSECVGNVPAQRASVSRQRSRRLRKHAAHATHRG